MSMGLGTDIGDGSTAARRDEETNVKRVAASMWILILVLATALVVTAGTIDGWFPDLLRVIRDVFVAIEPVAPFSTAFVAVVAGCIAWASHRHRRISDNRAEWWRRSQYAIDLVCRDNDKVGRNTGMTLLNHQLEDVSAARADLQMLDRTVYSLIQEVVDAVSPATKARNLSGSGNREQRLARRLGRQIRAVIEEVRR